MVWSYSAFALTRDDAALVFPLVRAAAPEIDLGRWQDFTYVLIGESSSCSGAIGIRNAAGYVCGLLVFHTEHDLRRGLVLAVSLFIALDLVKDAEAARALTEAAEAKVRELGCSAVHIRLGLTQKNLAKRLAAVGHHSEAILFSKEIGRPPSGICRA